MRHLKHYRARLHPENRSTIKVRNFLQNKFFPFKVDSFQKGLGVQESKQEVTKVVFLVTNSGKHSVSSPLKQYNILAFMCTCNLNDIKLLKNNHIHPKENIYCGY